MINFDHFNNIFELTAYFDSEAKCRKVMFESRWNKHDIDEAVYRYNTRKASESARFGFMFKKAIGVVSYDDVKSYAMAA